MSMTPKDIVSRAFAFEETDIIPYWLPMDWDVQNRLNEYYGTEDWRLRLKHYIFGFHCGFGWHPEAGDGVAPDAFGVMLRAGNICHIERPALLSPSLDGYQWPDINTIDDWDGLAETFKKEESSFRLLGMGFGLFERSWLMRGFETILMDMHDHPSFVEDLLDGILNMHHKAIDLITSRIPIDGYFGGDDMCDQRGPIMGTELWRRFYKPRLAETIDHCHKVGVPYIMHSCGNVAPLIDDLLEIGLDALESLQPEAMDIYELKKKTAGRMVLIGGMGAQSTLPFGSPDEVQKQTKRLIDEMGKGGGYVLAPSKPLLPDVPTPNAVAFIETALQGAS